MKKNRETILELFQENRTWSMAQIHKHMRGMDLSTVYRNVQRLVEAGHIVPVHAHGQETVYERAARPHHDHLVCQRCRGEECIPCPAPNLTNHLIELFGMCRTCSTVV